MFFNLQNKKKYILLLVFSYFFITSISFGVYIEDFYYSLTLKSILLLLGVSFLLTPLSFFVIYSIYKIIDIMFKTNTKENNSGKMFFIYWIFIFLGFLPVFLAYYPGLFNYDVIPELEQLNIGFSTYQPLAHSLLLIFFYKLFGNNHNLGLSLLTIVQMVLFSASLAYSLLFLYKVNIKKICRIILLLFYSFSPFISMLAISSTKDTIFSAFFLILITILGNIYFNPLFLKKTSNKILFITSLIGVGIFRNNGFFILIIFSTLLIILNRKRRDIFYSTIIGLFLTILISLILVLSVHAKTNSKVDTYYISYLKNGKTYILTITPKNEAYSIPLQQLSAVYTYHNSELTDDETTFIKKTIPNVNNYNKYFADIVKNSAKINNNFYYYYLKLFFKYPVTYIDAFISNNIGYWYILDLSNTSIYGASIENRQGFLLSDTKEGYGITHESKFNWLENVYEKLFSANEYQKNIFLFLLCDIAVYLWIYLISLAKTIYTKNINSLSINSLYLLLLLSLFLGPCTLIRYALPYIISLPILIITNFNKNQL